MASFIKQIYRTKTKLQEVEVFIDNMLTIPRAAYYKSESAVEKVVAKQLSEEFDSENVHTQYSVGGYWSLKCDVDLFDGLCGIELKLSKSLETAQEAQRVLGQLVYYSQRRYKENGLVLLVVGTKDTLSPKLKELKEYVEQIPGVHFKYKQTSK